MLIGFYNTSVILTYVGLIFSIVGMIYAFLGNIPLAIMCLILSGVCDMFDGTIARACKRNDKEKRFGVQIDSLVDVISFGIFPIIIGISLGLTSIPNIICYVIYALAAVIRLAYFNVLTEEKNVFIKKNKKNVKFYYGLPVTSIAIIIPFTYNLKLFYSSKVFLTAYPLILFITSILFILNIKIKKPTGMWYVVCSVLAVIEISIIWTAIR